jgi:hypothetical protein
MVEYLGTRAVVRIIESGGEEICPEGKGGCGQVVKFSAQTPSRFRKKVVANVYWKGKWNRLEVWHLHCYAKAGWVYGRPTTGIKAEDIEILDSVVRASDPRMSAPDLLLVLIDYYKKLNGKMTLG